jgi:hypothetical protein
LLRPLLRGPLADPELTRLNPDLDLEDALVIRTRLPDQSVLG